jgi:hypothetical protein
MSVPDCGPLTTTPSAPYYTPPPAASVAPGTSAPLGLPAPPATQLSVPGTAIPSVPGPQPPPATSPAIPADQPPSLLRSDGLQPIPDTRNYAPSPPSGIPSFQGSSSNSFQPSAPATNGKVDLTPVPDPDARSRGKSGPVVPSLFDPRDRTAGRGVWPVCAVAPIVWPEKSRRQAVRTATAEIMVESSERSEAPDADGWRAVRP